MNRLKFLIEEHNRRDQSRSSFSNLIKKIRLVDEFSLFVENYMTFGTFKQKLYHYANNLGDLEIICQVCKVNKVNWVEKDNCYRRVCSARCRGKLTNERNPNRKKIIHPVLYTKSDFIDYFGQNKIKLTEISLSKVYPDFVNLVKSTIIIDVPFQEKVYLYLNGMTEIPKCKHCKLNPVNYTYFTKGYHDYCSVTCSSNSEEKKSSIMSTVLDKYGVKNIGEVTREKALKTMDDRYGMHISKTDIFKEKFKKTSLENWGVEHYSKTDEYKEKFKKTLLKNWGVENPLQSTEILEKTLNTRKQNGHIYKWSEKELESIQLYRSAVTYYTERTYEKYKDIINPDNLDRGIHTNHVDHIFPVIKGWQNDIDPKLISHPKNLRLLSSEDNRSKGDRTEMTVEDFYEMIK